MILKIKYLVLLLAFTLNSCISRAQEEVYNAGSHFESGFARLTKPLPKNGENQEESKVLPDTTKDLSKTGPDLSMGRNSVQEFYIDTTGQVTFNTILRGGFYNGKEVTDYYNTLDSTLLPDQYYVEVKKGNKIGILTSDGRWILKPVYDQIDTDNSTRWRVVKDGQQNLFTREGFVLPFQFEQVYQMTDRYYNVVKDGKWGVYDKTKKQLAIPFEYQDMDYCYGCEVEGDYLFVEKNGKWGVIDFKNKVLLPFEYEHQHRNMRSDEIVLCLYKNDEQLLINLHTKKEIPYRQYQEKHKNDPDTTFLAGGFMRVEKQGKYGFANAAGKMVLPLIYDYIRYQGEPSPYSNDFPAPWVAINKEGHWGVADTTGQIIIKPEYESINIKNNSYFLVTRNKKEFLLDKNGQRLLDQGFDHISVEEVTCSCATEKTTFFKLENQGKYGILNPQTETFIAPQFDRIDTYGRNTNEPYLADVIVKDKKGVLNVHSGEMILKPKYDYYSDAEMPDHYWRVRAGSKYGLYDYKKGKLTIPPKYEGLYGLNKRNLLLMSENGKYGLVKVTGEVAVPAEYAQIDTLNTYFYLLTTQDDSYRNSFSFYNRKKKKIFIPSYDSIEAVYSDQLAIIRDNGRYKLYNPLKDKIIKGEYSKGGFPMRIDHFYHHRAVIKKGDKEAIIDEQGDYVIPPKYKGLSDLHQGYALMFNGEEDDFGDPFYGYIDSTGKVIVPAQYVFNKRKDIADYFKRGYLLLLGKWKDMKQPVGLANKEGKIIIPSEYDRIIFQENGSYILVQKEKKFGILDASGNVILPAQFDNIILDEKPALAPGYKFSFPVLAKKDGLYQYYKKDGSTLPIKTKTAIPFQAFWGY